MFLRKLLNQFRRFYRYEHYDSSAYWKSRAKSASQASVLWRNNEYNNLFRSDQQYIIKSVLEKLPYEARILDIGCGIGIVANMIADLKADAQIDAVDFPEMIHLALTSNSNDRICYVESSAETYIPGKEMYDLIVSSGCYSAIRDIAKLESALYNAAQMLKPDGLLLSIDPFHRWAFLARAMYGSKDVENFLAQHNVELVYKSGILFWPMREVLANSKISGRPLRFLYKTGELLLAILGKHAWADYKILIFKRKC